MFAHKVEIETANGLETITVEDGNTILQTALDQGIELSHDCKMGVCMTCPARLVRLSLALFFLLSSFYSVADITYVQYATDH